MKGIRSRNFSYIFLWVIYYAWVISFNSWWTASPFAANGFSVDSRGLLHAVTIISSAVCIFFVQKTWFIKATQLAAATAIIGFFLFQFTQNVQVEKFYIVTIGIALGCVNMSILMPFIFSLNNTEKLYTVVGSNVLINLISLFQEGNAGEYLQDTGDWLLSAILMVVALGTIVFFNKGCLPTTTTISCVDAPVFHQRIYLTLVFNCIFIILCKGIGKGILNNTAALSDYSVLTWYYLGGLAGCLLYFAVYALFKRPFVWLGNITFGFFAMGLFCNTFVQQIPSLAVVFALLLGAGSTVGIINLYYIVGIVTKKYNSMHYLELSVFCIGFCAMVPGILLGKYINDIHSSELSSFASILSAAVMILFIMLSAVISQSDYYDDWAKDSEKMEIDNEKQHMFEKYCLSKRETEVCKLLLQGYTMRQISGILSIAYPTVNTYCTAAYRKLEINSKTELLILFKDYKAK